MRCSTAGCRPNSYSKWMACTLKGMPEMRPEDVRVRLEALYRDLSDFPAHIPCPTPVARVYNALLAETRDGLSAEDPVIKALSALRPDPADKSGGNTATAVGTVR